MYLSHCILTCYSQLPQCTTIQGRNYGRFAQNRFKGHFQYWCSRRHLWQVLLLNAPRVSAFVNLILRNLHCDSITFCIHFPICVKVWTHTHIQFRKIGTPADNHLLFVVDTVSTSYLHMFHFESRLNHYQIQLLRVLLFCCCASN